MPTEPIDPYTQQISDKVALNIAESWETVRDMPPYTAEEIAGPIIASIWRLHQWNEGVHALQFLDDRATDEARRVLGVLDDVAALVSAAVGSCIACTNPQRANLIAAARDVVYALADAAGLNSTVHYPRASDLADRYGWQAATS